MTLHISVKFILTRDIYVYSNTTCIRRRISATVLLEQSDLWPGAAIQAGPRQVVCWSLCQWVPRGSPKRTCGPCSRSATNHPHWYCDTLHCPMPTVSECTQWYCTFRFLLFSVAPRKVITNSDKGKLFCARLCFNFVY